MSVCSKSLSVVYISSFNVATRPQLEDTTRAPQNSHYRRCMAYRDVMKRFIPRTIIKLSNLSSSVVVARTIEELNDLI